MIDDGRPSLLSAHRPSVLLATGGDLRCDPTRSPAEEALKIERALRRFIIEEAKITRLYLIGNVTSSKRQRALRGTSFIINQVMVHQCDPRPCPSPSKIHLQRTALLISSHSLRLAAKRPESKIEQNNVLSATLRM